MFKPDFNDIQYSHQKLCSVGDRIRSRREALGMTQEELAQKLGYKSRSSVNKVEKSRELSNKKVLQYANALHTTPGALMGWDLSESSDSHVVLDNNDELLIEIVSDLDNHSKQRVIAYAKKIKELHDMDKHVDK